MNNYKDHFSIGLVGNQIIDQIAKSNKFEKEIVHFTHFGKDGFQDFHES